MSRSTVQYIIELMNETSATYKDRMVLYLPVNFHFSCFYTPVYGISDLVFVIVVI